MEVGRWVPVSDHGTILKDFALDVLGAKVFPEVLTFGDFGHRFTGSILVTLA